MDGLEAGGSSAIKQFSLLLKVLKFKSNNDKPLSWNFAKIALSSNFLMVQYQFEEQIQYLEDALCVSKSLTQRLCKKRELNFPD